MKVRVAVYLLLVFLVAACDGATPTASTGRGFAYIWYVSTSGNDSDSCDDPGRACLTLAGVLTKARAVNTSLAAEYPDLVSVDHTINLAAGIYNAAGSRDGYPIANIDFNVVISGAGQESTIIDGASRYGGLFIHNANYARLRNFTIRNTDGSAPDSCINLRSMNNVQITNVTVTGCAQYGIRKDAAGSLLLTNVTAVENNQGVGSLDGELTIEGGNFSNNAESGISAGGNITMNFVRVEGNGRDGLAISGSGTLSEIQIVRNGQDGSFRAGLAVSGGSLTVENSTISNNQEGLRISGSDTSVHLIESLVSANPRNGILIQAGELIMNGTTVQGNGSFYRDTSLGGGLQNSGTATITDSIFSGNENGAISNDSGGEVTLFATAIVDNNGGLPALYNSSGATAHIELSLIANNRRSGSIVTGDNAIENRGTLTIFNSTVSGNAGNGVVSASYTNLSFVTIAHNSGYGLLASIASDDSARVNNVIIAENGDDCYLSTAPGVFLPLLGGHNIDTDGSCDFPETLSPAALLLGPLADNGGATLTHALGATSPAVDAAIGICPASDQRSFSRPAGPACDVGAFEVGGTLIALEAIVAGTPELFDIFTPTPPEEPVAIALQNASCRTGANAAFPVNDFLYKGEEARMVGRLADNSWFYVELPQNQTRCWVYADVLELLGAYTELLIYSSPELPSDEDSSGDEGGNGDQSGGSNSGQGGSAPAAPSNAYIANHVCTQQQYQVTIEWFDNANNEQGFRVYRGSAQIGSVGANVQKFVDNPPGSGPYTYTIEAYNTYGAKNTTVQEAGCLP